MDYDFMGLGDIVTDAFIRLKEADVHCDINHEKCQICMSFADKVPYESVTVVPAVGNSPNASVAAARLGLKTALWTNLGDDQNGRDAIENLKKEKVETSLVKVHPNHQTNYHYVLWYQNDRTILIKHEEYEYQLGNIGSPKWLYLSSLGEHSLPLHQELATYLANHPEIKLAFQPGTYQIKFGHEALAEIYERSEVFFCNVAEAIRILRINTNKTNDTNENQIKDLLQKIKNLGPKIVVITDGPKGAYCLADGDPPAGGWFMPPYPDTKPPYERTGAGDAFSSTFTAALALGKSVPEALRWAPINSMSVVQKIGAQAGLLTRPELETYLTQALADYQPKKI